MLQNELLKCFVFLKRAFDSFVRHLLEAVRDFLFFLYLIYIFTSDS